MRSRLALRFSQPRACVWEEAIRELGCDEDESTFDEMVNKVAKASPPRKDEKPKAAKPKR